jgi:hypothetical protein
LAWRWEQFTVDLPYRDGLPTVQQTLADRERWQREEDAARTAGDANRARDCRANAEQMTRQLGRLETLPPGKTYPLPLAVGRTGDALWVFVPGELYQVFQTSLRQSLGPHPVIVATITDDWQPGYLPQASSYGKGIYQDIISPLAPGCLETLLGSVEQRLRSLL